MICRTIQFFFQGVSPEFPGADFRGRAPKSGLDFSDKKSEFCVKTHQNSCEIPENFLGGCAPKPPFLLDFELITSSVIIFTILAAKMKPLTFSKAFVLGLIILSKTIY